MLKNLSMKLRKQSIKLKGKKWGKWKKKKGGWIEKNKGNSLLFIVIKSEPAQRVDPVAEPIRVRQKTGQFKNPAKLIFQCGIWNPLVYIFYIPNKKVIFSIWDLKPFSIYTLCSQEKNYIFLMWDKKLFGLNTST